MEITVQKRPCCSYNFTMASCAFVLIQLPESKSEHTVSTIYLHLEIYSRPFIIWMVSVWYQTKEIVNLGLKFGDLVLRREGFEPNLHPTGPLVVALYRNHNGRNLCSGLRQIHHCGSSVIRKKRRQLSSVSRSVAGRLR